MNTRIKSSNFKNYALSESKPIKFIDALKEKSNVVLFFEDPEYAQIIQFYFIKEGLQKGYTCVFTVNEGQDMDIVQQEMKDFGIDVESNVEKNSLYFFIVPPPNSEGAVSMEHYDKIMKTCKEKSKNVVIRFTGTWIFNVDSTRDLENLLKAEKEGHAEVKDLNIQSLCLYSVLGLPPKRRGFLIKQIMKLHDAVIFAPSIDKCMASYL